MPIGACCQIRAAESVDAEAVLDCARDVFATSAYTLTQADEFTMTVKQERAFIQEKLAAEHELFLIAAESTAAPCARADDERSLRSESPRSFDPAPPSAPPQRVIGMLDLKHPTKRRKHRHTALLGISVRSTHRAQGVGEALMRAAIAWAEQDPVLELMTLEVYAANTAGLHLYRKLGFIEYGRLPDGCKHDDATMWDQVMMVRKLKG